MQYVVVEGELEEYMGLPYTHSLTSWEALFQNRSIKKCITHTTFVQELK